MTRNPLPLWLALVFIVAALALPFLPFWVAIAAVVTFCAWAACEVGTFRRRARRIEDARALFQREIDRMPIRPEPARRQILQHVSIYPESWKPFTQPTPAIFDVDDRSDWPVQVDAR